MAQSPFGIDYYSQTPLNRLRADYCLPGNMKRLFDVVFCSILSTLFAVPMVLIAIAVKVTSKGPVLHWSTRVGRDNRIFQMPKFRTMHAGAPQVATHLLKNPDAYLTAIGGFLRRTSLDEIPQLFSVLRGDMTLVGPRPALFNQDDLIALRTASGVDRLRPGITGLAQINGRDGLPISEKVRLDSHYMKSYSFKLDVTILFMTAVKVARREGVSH
jgi:O-antigen biosynthesis protein WbqP